MNNQLSYIYTSEGRVTLNGTAAQYEYALKDHLGNSRVWFSDMNDDGVVDVNHSAATGDELIQEEHYYPFGLRMNGSWEVQTGGENAYQYSGKELIGDFGLGWSDFGARAYLAEIGRWNGVDELAEKYMGWSGYNYVANNPMSHIDPDGKDWYVHNKTGEYQWFDGNGRQKGYTGVGYYKVEYNKDKNELSVYKGKDSEYVQTLDMSVGEDGKYKSEQAAKFALISAELGGEYTWRDSDPTVQPLIIGAIIDNRLKLDKAGKYEFSSDGTVQGMSSREFHALKDDSYKDFKKGLEKRFTSGEGGKNKARMQIGLSTVYTATLNPVDILEKYYSINAREMVFYAHKSTKLNPVYGDFDIAIPRGTKGFQYVRGSNQFSDFLNPLRP